ncbi:MAG: ACP S-malonyltransferase [Candidatus Omnitrophota bacterium]|nr:ACP S-malonyltransferase [Candidatus Omnitrophota bacterium]
MVNQGPAYLFTGQGSQYPGMGKDLYEAFPESRAIFDKADKVLGFSLTRLCFEGPPEELTKTQNCQPAILTVSIAAFEAFKARVTPRLGSTSLATGRSGQEGQGLRVKFMAGLSLGEYSALCAAGTFSFEAGLKLVRIRAEIMDEATRRHPGTMAAVLDLDIEKIRDICLKSGAEIANINAPGQIVISGNKEAVGKASELCVEAGAKRVIELEVSGAFHSSLMLEASAELKQALQNTVISAPLVPVIANYTASTQSKAAEIEQNLVYQLYKPVRWVESVQYMLSQGVDKFYEFGPGKVLKGLMWRIDPEAVVVNIEKKEDILSL